MPLSGPGFELMRPSRRRTFGHRDLVAFLKRFGTRVVAKRLAPLLVGDLGQARGGPTPSGHRSHQTGLDVDVGYSGLVGKRLTKHERETVSPKPVVDLATMTTNASYGSRVPTLLEVAATDESVDRIFVHPAIKRALCGLSPRPTVWLSKIRPWWGHHDHFHVRLRCPGTDTACLPQAPLAPGDGCGAQELGWWWSDDARKTRDEKSAAAAAGPPPLPAACADLVR
jgi:penicillin-insensitive murein endopeptidase